MIYLGSLRPPAPYNLNLTADMLSRYHGVLDVYEDGDYWRALDIDGETVLVRVREMNTPAAPNLRVELLAGTASPAVVLKRIQHILAAYTDLAPFYSFSQNHPRLLHIIQPLIGVRHFRTETVFEALVNVIIEQQISLYAALRAQRAVAEWGDNFVEYEGVRYYTFPTVEQIAAADPVELHQLTKITRLRVSVIQQVAQAVVAGEFNIEALQNMPAEETYRQLLAIKGIGHWTAAWTLIRGLSVYDYVGHNDVALRSAVAHYFYDTDERVSADHVAETFAQYGEFAGLAAFYTLMRWAQDRY